MRHPQEALDSARARAAELVEAVMPEGTEAHEEDVAIAEAVGVVASFLADLTEAIVSALERNTEALKKS